MIPNIIGYHTNSKEKCERYINEGIFIESKDIKWLGCGMYFWDNISNAIYWREEKIRKMEAAELLIIKANVLIEELLDLTDLQVLEFINQMWDLYCERINRKKRKAPMGKKLDALFKMFEELDESYSVMKVNGFYKKTPVSDFFVESNNSMITNKVKTIYCVRRKEKAVEAEIFEKEVA